MNSARVNSDTGLIQRPGTPSYVQIQPVLVDIIRQKLPNHRSPGALARLLRRHDYATQYDASHRRKDPDKHWVAHPMTRIRRSTCGGYKPETLSAYTEDLRSIGLLKVRHKRIGAHGAIPVAVDYARVQHEITKYCKEKQLLLPTKGRDTKIVLPQTSFRVVHQIDLIVAGGNRCAAELLAMFEYLEARHFRGEMTKGFEDPRSGVFWLQLSYSDLFSRLYETYSISTIRRAMKVLMAKDLIIAAPKTEWEAPIFRLNRESYVEQLNAAYAAHPRLDFARSPQDSYRAVTEGLFDIWGEQQWIGCSHEIQEYLDGTSLRAFSHPDETFPPSEAVLPPSDLILLPLSKGESTPDLGAETSKTPSSLPEVEGVSKGESTTSTPYMENRGGKYKYLESSFSSTNTKGIWSPGQQAKSEVQDLQATDDGVQQIALGPKEPESTAIPETQIAVPTDRVDPESPKALSSKENPRSEQPIFQIARAGADTSAAGIHSDPADPDPPENELEGRRNSENDSSYVPWYWTTFVPPPVAEESICWVEDDRDLDDDEPPW